MPLLNGIGFKVLLVVVLATAVTSRQYQVRDDEDSSEGGGGGASKEYNDYYGDESQATEQEDAKSSAGFVEPIDFSSFFTAGFGNSPAGSSKIDNFFTKQQGAEVNPFSLGSGIGIGGSAFPAELQASATTNNGSGFISPSVNFQSLFDSDSAATVGFRPQDFLKRSSNAGEDEDGITEETAPSDFFSPSFANVDDDFGSSLGGGPVSLPTSQEYKPRVLPTKAYDPSGYTPNKQSGKYAQGGKSSYPAPAKYPSQSQYGSPTPASLQHYANTPTARPQTAYRTSTKPSSASLPYSGYPSKSASTYNPTGAYLSKPGYKTTGVDKSPYKTYASPSYDSKSVYPKKASDFYPSKVGHRPTAGTFRPTPAQTKLSPSYHYSASVPQEGKARYVAPQDYYKFGPSQGDEETKAEYSTPSSSYVTARASSRDSAYLAPTSSPYAPSEYGKEDDYHNAEPAENDEIKINPASDKKNCRKIEKQLDKEAFTSGRFRRDAMTCYACDNPKTGGTFEKCLYDSDPEGTSQDYFHGHATSYSDKIAKPTNVRLRRDVEASIKFDNAYSDVVFDTLHTFSEPLVRVARQEPSSSYGKSYEDYISKFASPSKKNQYQPEHYTPHDYDDDKAEYKSSPTTNADQNCKKVVKGTMTCSVCQNPKTGGQSEQCSYATTPKENNYFVARQSSFNSKKPREGSESRQSRQEPHAANHGYNNKNNKNNNKNNNHNNNNNGGPTEGYYSRKSIAPYDHSSEVAAAVTKKGSYKGPLDISPSRYDTRRSDNNNNNPTTKQYRQKNVQPTQQYNSEDDYGSSTQEYDRDDVKQDRSVERRSDESRPVANPYYNPSKSYDDYFKAVFPELAGQESKNARSDDYDVQKPDSAEVGDAVDYYKAAPSYYYPDVEQKKDLEKVLGEFSQKDRSSCEKVIRDKMTCYQCTDKKGMQHEECMFVAASEPKSQHLAYHELKEFRLVPNNTASLDSASAHSTDAKQTATTTPEPSTTTTIPKSKTYVTRKRRIVVPKKVRTTMTTKTTTTTTTTTQPSPPKTTTLTTKSRADRPVRRSSRYAKTMSITVKTPSATTSTHAPRGRQAKRVGDVKVAASERQETRAQPEQDEEEEEGDETRQKEEEEEKPEREEPAPKEGEFVVDRDGLYSAETRDVFDPVLKIYLPEYMLTRSEHEEIFDEVMNSGR